MPRRPSWCCRSRVSMRTITPGSLRKRKGRGRHEKLSCSRARRLRGYDGTSAGEHGGRCCAAACKFPVIPCNREFNREFCTFHPFWRQNGRISPAISASYSEIPYAGEQGIFSTRTGNFSPEQGINRELQGI